MREKNEEKKRKEPPTGHNSKKQSKDKDKSVHWGENVVHNVENGKNNSKRNEEVKESHQ
jgi:hypothetical protein